MRACNVILFLGLSALLTAYGSPNSAYYSFTVGNINATVISDGFTVSNATTSYPDAHPAALEKALSSNFLSEALPFHFNPLYLDLGDRKIMMDVGAGNTFLPGTGQLLANMAAAGLDPNDITDVVLTHAHADHMGGITKPDGSLAFPSARVHLSREEFEFWRSTSPEELTNLPMEIAQLLVTVATNSIDAVSERLELFELGDEIIPGITSKPLGGHTVGMSGFMIRDGEYSLMTTADVLLWEAFSIQQPEWRLVFDTDSDQAIATRFTLLRELADSGMMFHSYHTGFPSLGRIFRLGDGYGLRQETYFF